MFPVESLPSRFSFVFDHGKVHSGSVREVRDWLQTLNSRQDEAEKAELLAGGVLFVGIGLFAVGFPLALYCGTVYGGRWQSYAGILLGAAAAIYGVKLIAKNFKARNSARLVKYDPEKVRFCSELLEKLDTSDDRALKWLSLQCDFLPDIDVKSCVDGPSNFSLQRDWLSLKTLSQDGTRATLDLHFEGEYRVDGSMNTEMDLGEKSRLQWSVKSVERIDSVKVTVDSPAKLKRSFCSPLGAPEITEAGSEAVYLFKVGPRKRQHLEDRGFWLQPDDLAALLTQALS